MDSKNEQPVLYQVPLLRRPKKTTSKPERMSRRTASNTASPPSNLSTAIPNPRTPNSNVAKSAHLDSQTITAFTIHDRRVKSGIDQNESTILPQAPTNSPTKSPSDQEEGTALHPLEPRGPAPFFPRNKKIFNTQASLYAQLFSCPPPPSQEHFTLNEFQFFAKHRPSFTFSNTTVIKSYQNYKKLTSWLEAFPPSQAALNTLKLEVDVEMPQVRIPKHQYLLEVQAYMRDRLDLSSAVSLEESEMDQMILTGYLPPGDIVLQGPVSGYFCGEKRCNSPFASKKPMQLPSDAALLKCMESDCRELNLKAQFLHCLPDISLLAEKLTVLNLSFNMLKILPSSIFAATNLEELYLRNNPLLLISDLIGSFTRLHTLSVSFCLLEDLPLSIYKLSRLRELDVSYNRIKRISHNISNLRGLVFLNLEGNELPGLPAELTYLKDLKYLKKNSNYMHPLISSDYINRHPDHLQDICLRYLLREFYDDDTDSMPPYIKEFSNQRYHQCANCELIFFGCGREIVIPSLTPDHPVNSFPVLHIVCAERCVPFLREKLKQN